MYELSEKTGFNFDFSQYLKERRDRLEDSLSLYLDGTLPETLWQSMRYSVLSGGKRLRAILSMAGAEAVVLSGQYSEALLPQHVKDPVSLVLPLACAIEMVHAMSLIHDDLPCLDNDDLRRGKPTNHKVYGEAMALLAGDGLLMQANEILLSKTDEIIKKEHLLSVALELSRATGPSGMVGGQVLDMEFTGAGHKAISADVVGQIHAAKTGALIRFALWSGGQLLGGGAKQLTNLKRLGEIIGLAFQITDDLLDVTGTAESLGKTPGKDQATSKATWISVFGEEGSRKKLKELEEEGQTLIKEASLDNQSCPVLLHLLQYSINRKK